MGEEIAQDRRDALRSAFHLADRLKVETVAVDHAASLDRAEARGLAAYDSSYLWLALDAELVTLDRERSKPSCSRAIRQQSDDPWHPWGC